MNNPYQPPSLPTQEKEEQNIDVNIIYKEFFIWGVSLAALFFFLDSLRTLKINIIKSTLLVVQYIVDLNI
jgi:hypothetical protein